jgi:hypothetical protein
MIPDYHYPPDPSDGPDYCDECDDIVEDCECEEYQCTDTRCQDFNQMPAPYVPEHLRDLNLDDLMLHVDEEIRTAPNGKKYRVVYMTDGLDPGPVIPLPKPADPNDFAGKPVIIKAGTKDEDKSQVPWVTHLSDLVNGDPGIGKSAGTIFFDEYDPAVHQGSTKPTAAYDGGEVLDGQARWRAARDVCCSELREFERTLQGTMIDDYEIGVRRTDGEYSPALRLHLEEMKAQVMSEAKRTLREWPRCWSTHELTIPEFSVQLVAFAPDGLRPSVTLHFRCPEHHGHSIREYKEVE